MGSYSDGREQAIEMPMKESGKLISKSYVSIRTIERSLDREHKALARRNQTSRPPLIRSFPPISRQVCTSTNSLSVRSSRTAMP